MARVPTLTFILSDDCQLEECSGPNCSGYRGRQDITISGRTCQAWNQQTPHQHSNTPENKPDEGFEANYCRNPHGNTETIWCYTTDPSTRLELCKPKSCKYVNIRRNVYFINTFIPFD